MRLTLELHSVASFSVYDLSERSPFKEIVAFTLRGATAQPTTNLPGADGLVIDESSTAILISVTD